METQTHFDLSAAIENWRQELAAQPDLTPDVRRELETHLRDSITGFQQRGLNDEEPFRLAQERVGQPKQLGEEFGKTDPAKRWRERAFWTIVVLYGMYLWLMLIGFSQLWVSASLFQRTSFKDVLPASILTCLPLWLRGLPMATFFRSLFSLILFMPVLSCAGIFAVARSNKLNVIWNSLFESRSRFALISLFAFMAVNSFNILFF